MTDGEEVLDDVQRRLDRLSARVDAVQELVAELQADGLLNQQHVEQLEEALVASRTIGAAIGILMAKLDVDEEKGFAILRRVSQAQNRKLREIASDLVASGNLDVLR
jgi:AmiR/NasT family two-component response regulator